MIVNSFMDLAINAHIYKILAMWPEDMPPKKARNVSYLNK